MILVIGHMCRLQQGWWNQLRTRRRGACRLSLGSFACRQGRVVLMCLVNQCTEMVYRSWGRCVHEVSVVVILTWLH